MQKLNTDELASAESPSPETAVTDPQNVQDVTKKKRRRSRRRGRGGGANAAQATSEATEQKATENGAGVQVAAKAQSRPDAQAPKNRNGARKRRGENGSRKGSNGGKRPDIGSWRAEPHSERMRRRPGQAQAQSPSLWAGWSAAHFGGKTSNSEDD